MLAPTFLQVSYVAANMSEDDVPTSYSSSEKDSSEESVITLGCLTALLATFCGWL